MIPEDITLMNGISLHRCLHESGNLRFLINNLCYAVISILTSIKISVVTKKMDSVIGEKTWQTS